MIIIQIHFAYHQAKLQSEIDKEMKYSEAYVAFVFRFITTYNGT